MRWTGVLVCVGLLSAAGSALAHHSIAAMYDRDKSVEVEGVVSRVEMMNPHTMLEVTAPAVRGGAPVKWTLESRGVQGMQRMGFEPGAISVGEKVKVKGQPARDGSHQLWLTGLETAAGKTFEFGFGRPAN